MGGRNRDIGSDGAELVLRATIATPVGVFKAGKAAQTAAAPISLARL